MPVLTSSATVHSGCCLALSAPFLSHIHSLLPPPPDLILSIGSGFGLLEALLLAADPPPSLVGIEVQPSPNRYLARDHHREVYGTRGIHELASEASAWMFIYPRRVGLVEEYLEKFGNGVVKIVIWIGPRADWEDYKGCFAGAWELHVKCADQIGGRAWEVVAVATKSRHRSKS
ncbi:uncharacterized protein BDR25DRAFT_242112 [Lindgomyces ingoldianus]|uniref:Uncharacterized protein n=1 Tax=Lindgomyces ingoldianus TaxID=673940 RepID=A0ACB6QC96_9PLEO|nr:uncharacterized protein BDR25DRAFT_242112 [Lindgomyces ingoldianus]KAF2464599.1 hypothetical protein BDR25DRAFT_242112 [Lindgomyces ingoldianus]